MRGIFKAFADRNNYPIYFHCLAGADRTGTIAFLLEALLGEEEVALMDDYEITTLSRQVRLRNTPSFQRFLERLNAFNGETFEEKTLNCLLGIGGAKEDIEKIKNIMVERI